MSALLQVSNLTVRLAADSGATVVRGVDLSLESGQALALVGESGCGKSTLLFALLDLLPAGMHRSSGEVLFDGRNLTLLDPRVRRRIAGNEIGAVFQEPTRALNPLLRVGEQIAEVLRCHQGLTRRKAWSRAVALLEEVGIERPELRARDFPHQLSGGMNQRVVIAMAIACSPALLVADEPTTALDVTVQAEILDLFDRLRAEHDMALLFVTHDLSIIRRRVDRIAVMYAGEIVEEASAGELFENPRHPYTSGLLACRPGLAQPLTRLREIGGVVPRLEERPDGCAFHPRCSLASSRCRIESPVLQSTGDRRLACLHPDGDPVKGSEGVES